MTTKISLVRALPNSHWGEPYFLNLEIADWCLDLVYLQHMWEIDEDTILETPFYEPFVKTPSERIIELDDLPG